MIVPVSMEQHSNKKSQRQLALTKYIHLGNSTNNTSDKVYNLGMPEKNTESCEIQFDGDMMF